MRLHLIIFFMLTFFPFSSLMSQIVKDSSHLYFSDKVYKNGVVAHRGAWKKEEFPKNSLAAFKKALTLGVSGTEFDLHLTKDGVLVVNHDADYDGISIENTNYSKLRKSKLPNGESIPTFRSFLKVGIKQEHTLLVAELKPSSVSKERSLVLATKVVEEVRQMKAQRWMIYISFDYAVLKEILRMEPSALTMYLGGDILPEQLLEDGIFGADYHQQVYEKDDNLIENLKKNGRKINVWTLNDPDKMDYFIQQNIDFFTTDEPELLLEKIVKKP